MEGASTKFVCVWFEFAGHVMLLDRTTAGAREEPSAGDAAPGWRLVVASAGERPGDAAGAPVRASSVMVWPPLQPVDLPLLIGPEPEATQLEVFDLNAAVADASDSFPASLFRLDRSLAVGGAESCWVLPCRDPDESWRDGMFGDPVRIGCDALTNVAPDHAADKIVACAHSVSPAVGRALCWLVVPTAGLRVGPAVLAQYRPAAAGPVVDVLMQARPDGTQQPAIELQAAPAADLRALLARFRFYVLRRNALGLGLPGVARRAGTQGAAAGGRVIVTLPEPIFHGDVVAVVAQGVAFQFAPRLAARGLQPAIGADGCRVGLMVRREDDVAAAAGDAALVRSGLIDHLAGVIRAEAAPTEIDGWLWRLKRQLAASLRRIGFATSHLLPPALAERARVELARLLVRERTARLDRLAYAAAVPHRMQSLLAQSLPLDHSGPGAAADGGLAPVIADVSGFAAAASNAAEQAVLAGVLADPAAAAAALAVGSRSAALAAWLEALAR